MSKTCNLCGEDKPLSEYRKRAASKDGLQRRCKPCFTEYSRKKRKQWADEGNLVNQWLERTHKNKPCLDCGVAYPPCVMDFDHRIGEVKSFNIGTHGHEKATDQHKAMIEREIAKCDMVCSNCHRIRTKKRYDEAKRSM